MRIATSKDKQLIVDILVSAFDPLQDDNSINFIVKQDEKRTYRMQLLMAYLFDNALDFGEIYISDNEKACLLLKFSDKEKITFKSIASNLKLAYKCIGLHRVFSVLKRQHIANKHYPKEKHIRPMIAGVKAENDGNGSAARLMIEVKNHYKGNTLPVIIDAASKKNAAMYQKFGFRIFKEEAGLGFPIYFLRLN